MQGTDIAVQVAGRCEARTLRQGIVAVAGTVVRMLARRFGKPSPFSPWGAQVLAVPEFPAGVFAPSDSADMEKVVLAAEQNRPDSLHRIKGRAGPRHALRLPTDHETVATVTRLAEEGLAESTGFVQRTGGKRDAPRVHDREGLGGVSWLEGFVRTNREGNGWLSRPQSRTPQR